MNSAFFTTLIFLCFFLGGPVLLAQPELRSITTKDADTVAIMNDVRRATTIADFDAALQLLRHAYQRSAATGFTEGKLRSSLEAGRLYFKEGRYPESLQELEQALSFTRDYPYYLGVVHNNLGNTYNLMSRLDKAIAHYEKAAAYSTAYPSKRSQPSYAYNNLSTIMSQQKQYGKALYYIEKALPDAVHNLDTALFVNLLLNKGIILGYEQKFKEAQNSFSIASHYAQQARMQDRLFVILLNSASVALMAEDPRMALAKLQLARKVGERQDLGFREKISLLSATGDTYIQLNELNKAKPFLRAAWSLAANDPSEQTFILSKLSVLEHRTGNHLEAYRLSERYHALKDSLAGKEIAIHVQELETRFRTREKDEAIGLQTAYIASQHELITRKNYWIIIISLSATLLVFIVGLLYFRVRHKQRLAQRAQEIKRLENIIEGEEKERQRLAQELHDGISSQLAGAQAYLGSLPQLFPSVAVTEAYQQVRSILNDTAKDVRKISHNLLPNELSKAGLVRAIQHFIARSGGEAKTHFEFHAYGDFSGTNPVVALNIYRIVQEIVHNVLKHAKAQDSIILLNKHAQEISIVAEDNGVGFDANAYSHTNSVGLDNIKGRVKAMSGSLQIESAPGKGTVITIFFPLHLNAAQPAS